MTTTTKDAWTETIEHDVEVVFRDGDGNVIRVLDLDRVRFEFDAYDGKDHRLAPIEAYYGDGYTFATLEGARAFVRKWLARAVLPSAEREELEIEEFIAFDHALQVERTVMLAVINDPGINSRGLLSAVHDEIRCKDSDVRDAVRWLTREGVLVVTDGPNRAKLHTAAPGQEREGWIDPDIVGRL